MVTVFRFGYRFQGLVTVSGFGTGFRDWLQFQVLVTVFRFGYSIQGLVTVSGFGTGFRVWLQVSGIGSQTCFSPEDLAMIYHPKIIYIIYYKGNYSLHLITSYHIRSHPITSH